MSFPELNNTILFDCLYNKFWYNGLKLLWKIFKAAVCTYFEEWKAYFATKGLFGKSYLEKEIYFFFFWVKNSPETPFRIWSTCYAIISFFFQNNITCVFQNRNLLSFVKSNLIMLERKTLDIEQWANARNSLWEWVCQDLN